MSFFRDNYNHFQLQPSESTGLRECQLGAIWALKSHYTTSSNEIASLVSMPTGSGKTALMMAVCFELQIGKVLIVVPSKVLRRQLCDQFRSLQVLKNCGCLPQNLPNVNVYEVEKRQTSRQDWEVIVSENDVIVAHPNSISPYYSELSPLPVDLIDTVFIDEAHHEAAPTWQSLNDYYITLKRVFYTATPFRRDRKRMRAKLVYHYPLERALDVGILRPVNFQGEQLGLTVSDRNQSLLLSAVDAFQREKSINSNAAILIRTDRIEGARELMANYVAAGLNVDVIHSKRRPNVNSDLVKKVINNELDGLVCVGIASEGLDIPSLKVAVLHTTPRSIPYTIQFLGRISRQAQGQEGPATLIANKDEVKGEVTKLYKSDKSWGRLIPSIVDSQMRRARHYRSSHASETDFQMPELNVFFSALIYETPTGFAFEQEFDTNNAQFKILHIEQDNEDAPLVIVTSYDKPIEWSKRGIYLEDMLDVHIFYYNTESNLLFELTTSEVALASFKENLITANVNPLSQSNLYKTLSSFDQSDYIMVGMKNSAMRGSAQPAYKTVIGSGVQASVRSSEGRVFSTGHALLKLDQDNTWGIATKRARVWAMKRGTSQEFKLWCDELSQLIVNGPITTSLPGLSFLASSTPTNSIETEPIAIVPDDIFFRVYSLLIEVQGGQVFRNIIPNIDSLGLDTASGILRCKLSIRDYECDLIMDFNNADLWTVDTTDTILVRADRNENNVIECTLQHALNNFPPSLIMPNGDVIEGRNRITPNRSIEKLPASIWKGKTWSNCLITSERYDVNAGANSLPVINKTIEFISGDFDANHDVLFHDDRANEVADLIWFQGAEKIIHLIHCKPSSEVNPGCRTSDSDVLFAQAMRSIHWVASSALLERLNDRLQQASEIVLGSQNVFNAIRNDYRINDWQFNIILAQPGFKLNRVSNRDRSNNNVYELAIPVYERIKGSMADLEIWCSS